MTIAVIGTGNVGRALTSSLVRAGHSVVMAARDERRTAETAAALGARAAATPRQAAAEADAVILAVPADSLEAVATDIAPAVEGKPVVDATNRMAPDPTSPSNAEHLRDLLPNASVVKAFNTAFASVQADPQRVGFPADGFVAADDPDAKRVVLDLVSSIGFRPVDAGPLPNARMLEGMAWLNISRNLEGGSWQSAWAIVDPAA